MRGVWVGRLCILGLLLLLSACTGPKASPAPDSVETLHQAYTTLLDSYVEPLDPTILALGATTGMAASLARHGVTVQASDLPAFEGGTRDQVWTVLDHAYGDLTHRYSQQETPQALAYDAVSAMAASVNDCHTTFTNPQELADEQAALSGTTKFGGIGAFLLDRPGDPPAIREVFQDGPAEKAGVKSGDVIRRVDGKDTSSLPARQVAGLIRGPEGTPVNLTLERRGGVMTDVKVVRQQVSPPLLTGNHIAVAKNVEIAYLHLYSFPSSLTSQVDAIFTGLQKYPIKAWIIDLRENGGGELEAMQAFASKFLHRGPLEQLQDREGKITLLPTKGTVLQTPQPLVVLVNENSASASEMFAAAVQEQGAGHVIGNRTAGCLGVAEEVKLKDGSGLQIKVEKVLTGLQAMPLNGNGITPDQVVELTNADLLNQHDPQRDAAMTDVLDQLRKAGHVTNTGA